MLTRFDELTCHQIPSTFTAAAAHWYAIQDGTLDRVQAFMQGLMKIEGDMSLLMQLEESITRLAPPWPAGLA